MGHVPVADQQTSVAEAPRELRDVMRHFATGVCVVSTYAQRDGEREHDAITVNSLTSVSLDPPLISLSFRSDSGFLATLMETQVWGVSILDAGSEQTARLFARPKHERDLTLRTLPTQTGASTGALLFEASGWMECRYRDHVIAGDHVMVIGEVLGMGVHDSPAPLIFLQGGFHRFEPQPR